MPKVNKNILILTSGILWTGVGIMLMRIATIWFSTLPQNELVLDIIGGIILGLIILYFGFSKIATKNIERINLYNDKVCFWAFQKWQSYILIIFMMALGIFMRKISSVPKFILTPMYIAIGFALFSGSFKYYMFLFHKKKSNYH